MATSRYSMTFAGVPFNLDYARVIRLGSSSREEEGEAISLHKQQPYCDFVEEIDKKIPFRYLQEFTMGPGVGNSRLSQNYVQIYPTLSPDVRIGDFYYPHDMGRYSYFRGLAVSSQAKVMLAACTGSNYALTTNATITVTSSGTWNPQPFVMKNIPFGAGESHASQITTNMYLLPPRPLAENAGSKYDGLYLITLVDERFYLLGKQVALNVGSYSLSTGGSSSSNNSSWQDLISQLGTSLGITIVPPTIADTYLNNPPDPAFWGVSDSAALLLDALAYSIGCVVVRNLDGTYSLLNASQSASETSASRRTGATIRTAGGELYSSNTSLRMGDASAAKAANIPATVNVSFPRYFVGENSPLGVYTIPVSSNSLGYSTNIGIAAKSLMGFVPAKMPFAQASTPTNDSNLQSLATQMATDYLKWQTATAVDEVYPGILNWNPDGLHDIVWCYSAKHKQASTRALRISTTPNYSAVGVKPTTGGNLTVRDSFSGVIYPLPTSGVFNPYVGPPSVQLASDLSISGNTVFVATIDCLPTQNRWRGLIGNEVILFEGTSGGLNLPFVGCSGGYSLDSTSGLPPDDNPDDPANPTDGPGYSLSPGPNYDLGTGGGGFNSPDYSLGTGGGALSTKKTNATIGVDPPPDIPMGMSGTGYTIDIVSRGMDGTFSDLHASGVILTQIIPDATFNVNQITYEKMQFVYPSAFVSGTVQGVSIVPQIQNIRVLADECPTIINNIAHYPAQVLLYNTQKFGNQFTPLEFCWAVERNSNPPISGSIYDGQMVGFSFDGPPTAPVYAFNDSSTQNSPFGIWWCVIKKTSGMCPDFGNNELITTASGFRNNPGPGYELTSRSGGPGYSIGTTSGDGNYTLSTGDGTKYNLSTGGNNGNPFC